MGWEWGSGRRVRGKRGNSCKGLNPHALHWEILHAPMYANAIMPHTVCFKLNLFGDWVTLSQVALSDGVTAPTVGY